MHGVTDSTHMSLSKLTELVKDMETWRAAVYGLTESGFPHSSVGKESACNAGDLGLIPGSGRSPGGGHGHSSILAWRILWTEEPGGPQPMESQGSDKT